ncbi:phosphopantothenate--cysteine ligase [Streptococcus oralis]|uniref:Phosphopantothenoylcysteine synthetase n=1 Tax=Streptococcus oralis TaxID=1303 RepID=A0A139PEM8_STROR|nr:phosphopantothenate--cysteine ligase [Streptococcus oralis]KXT87465.1 Phosphopantothenoylcysteine synthetase [Streptococcus oralis]
MKILVTSGGTSEAIDQVRAITNHSTGQLGKIISEKLLAAGHEVFLITTRRAVKPAPHPQLTIREITNTQDLLETVKNVVQDYQVFIHSMAVSDYTPVYMTSLEEVASIPNVVDLLSKKNEESKISSKEEVQVLFLKKTPKVISLIKEWNPAIHLIGFKLLVDVSQDKLIQVARNSLKTNQADLIVANDLSQIRDQQHLAYLVSNETVETVHTKEEIAQALVKNIQNLNG